MKRKVCFLLVIVLILVDNSIAQLHNGIQFKETEKNETPKEYHKILIIGKGSTANRFFFDEIVSSLSKKITKKSIVIESHFFSESENEEANEKEIIQQLLLKEKYDALFFITPERPTPNGAVISNESGKATNMIIDKATAALNIISPQLPHVGGFPTSYFIGEGKYFLEVYDAQNLDSEIWSAILNVDVNPGLTNKTVYNSISNKIIESLISNHLIKK